MEEQAFMDHFQAVDVKGNGTIEPDQAFGFFKTSGIPNNGLNIVWRVSDLRRKGYLQKDEFFIAMRAIAMIQNKVKLTPPALYRQAKRNERSLLPRFLNKLKPQIQPIKSQSQPSSTTETPPNEEIINSQRFITRMDFLKHFKSSDLDKKVLAAIWTIADPRNIGKIDQNAFKNAELNIEKTIINNGNLPFSLNDIFETVKLQQKQTTEQQININQPKGQLTNNSGLFKITKEEYYQAMDLYKSFDPTNIGFLTGENSKMIHFFQSFGLNNDILGHIWFLSDPKQSGKIIPYYFQGTYHLLKACQNDYQIPQNFNIESILYHEPKVIQSNNLQSPNSETIDLENKQNQLHIQNNQFSSQPQTQNQQQQQELQRQIQNGRNNGLNNSINNNQIGFSNNNDNNQELNNENNTKLDQTISKNSNFKNNNIVNTFQNNKTQNLINTDKTNYLLYKKIENTNNDQISEKKYIDNQNNQQQQQTQINEQFQMDNESYSFRGSLNKTVDDLKVRLQDPYDSDEQKNYSSSKLQKKELLTMLSSLKIQIERLKGKGELLYEKVNFIKEKNEMYHQQKIEYEQILNEKELLKEKETQKIKKLENKISNIQEDIQCQKEILELSRQGQQIEKIYMEKLISDFENLVKIEEQQRNKLIQFFKNGYREQQQNNYRGMINQNQNLNGRVNQNLNPNITNSFHQNSFNRNSNNNSLQDFNQGQNNFDNQNQFNNNPWINQNQKINTNIKNDFDNFGFNENQQISNNQQNVYKFDKFGDFEMKDTVKGHFNQQQNNKI
ncbi:hypothetical protein M0812_11245 [Anaeramoeba flamelloides]|uniref:Uncharacterized protein n=1 Tax=Anaeramoeba flamelloides TaxID=1746091 RepID=A0AAV7ZXN3_9EUKA|nr:hypothetical protein M0812_11245 [Anaeramoeba flamelloides]